MLLDRAVEARIISAEERQQVLNADKVRDEVIEVDAFDPETFRARYAAERFLLRPGDSSPRPTSIRR